MNKYSPLVAVVVIRIELMLVHVDSHSIVASRENINESSRS